MKVKMFKGYGVRSDNRIENLEYLTKSQNNQISYDSGRRNVSGTRNANCKTSESQIRRICEILESGDYKTTVEIAKKVGVSKNIVRSVRAKRQWTCISRDYNF